MSLAGNLKRLRKKRGWSQTQLAELILNLITKENTAEQRV
jgi:transcriptional regulator with XRE-family HTH domain